MPLNSLVIFLFITLSPNNLFHGDTLSPNNLKLKRASSYKYCQSNQIIHNISLKGVPYTCKQYFSALCACNKCQKLIYSIFFCKCVHSIGHLQTDHHANKTWSFLSSQQSAMKTSAICVSIILCFATLALTEEDQERQDLASLIALAQGLSGKL